NLGVRAKRPRLQLATISSNRPQRGQIPRIIRHLNLRRIRERVKTGTRNRLLPKGRLIKQATKGLRKTLSQGRIQGTIIAPELIREQLNHSHLVRRDDLRAESRIPDRLLIGLIDPASLRIARNHRDRNPASRKRNPRS